MKARAKSSGKSGALLRDYPAFAPALVSMAEIEIAQKKYAIAEPRLARAVEQDETNEKAHFVYARLAALTGRTELAREHLSLALHYGGASYKRMAEQDPALRSMRP